jgi:hypothetical protein
MCLAAMLLFASYQVSGQSKKEKKLAAIEKAIADKSYIFKASAVSSSNSGQSGGFSSDYELMVTPDSVISDLPYFGSSNFPTSNFTQSPLRFNSSKFQYVVQNKEKGGWDIFIRFMDVQEVKGMTLSLTKDGYGTLQVTPAHVQSIAFSGSLQKR